MQIYSRVHQLSLNHRSTDRTKAKENEKRSSRKWRKDLLRYFYQEVLAELAFR